MPPPYERLVFICTNRRPEGAPKPSCAARGSEEVRTAFKRELAARGLVDVVRATSSGCLDACEQGVSVVIYPDDVWYGGVRVEDVPEIVESHVIGGRPVERLRQVLPSKGPRKLPLLG
jgi:(2Fe-2S) ferredoxin